MLSPADVAVLSGQTGNRNNDGFGFDNGAWWIIILLLFGWGRNGFGGNGGNFGGSDNGYCGFGAPNIYGKLDGITYGISDATFALNNNITSGFNNVQSTLCQGFAGINNGLTVNGYETRGAITDLGYRLQDCCCKTQQAISDCCCQTQRAIDNVNYNMATNTNAIQQKLCTNTRDIIENQNANYRALHDEIVANRIEDKNAQITAQQNEINALRLKASQEAQNAYLISQLGPKCPEPAYVVNGPTPVNFPTNCCNTFSGFNTCGNY